MWKYNYEPGFDTEEFSKSLNRIGIQGNYEADGGLTTAGMGENIHEWPSLVPFLNWLHAVSPGSSNAVLIDYLLGGDTDLIPYKDQKDLENNMAKIANQLATYGYGVGKNQEGDFSIMGTLEDIEETETKISTGNPNLDMYLQAGLGIGEWLVGAYHTIDDWFEDHPASYMYGQYPSGTAGY